MVVKISNEYVVRLGLDVPFRSQSGQLLLPAPFFRP